METRRNNAYIRRPRIQEDRETVRRQQKELRRIRQRERRQKMTVAQIEQQRERARQYYLQRKYQQPMKLTKQMNVLIGEPRMDPSRTVVGIKQFTPSDLACQSQQRGNLKDQKLMKQTEEKNTIMDRQSADVSVESKTDALIRRKNRLTNVKREARSKVNRNKDVRPPRLTQIRRQARGLNRGFVDERDRYGIDVQKLGSSPDKDWSLIRDHAQILIDISRMNTYSSISIASRPKEGMEIDLNKKVADDQFKRCDDAEESTSDSDEVLAFLSGLSAKKKA